MIKHGSLTGYTWHRCRCTPCTRAMRDYTRVYRGTTPNPNAGGHLSAREYAFSDLLHELFPLGLTDDCPARRKHHARRWP